MGREHAGRAARRGRNEDLNAARVRITVRVRPGASRTRVGGSYGDALVVAVNAPAVDGRATDACLRAVAEALAVPVRRVSLVSGATNRTKVLDVMGDPEQIRARLSMLLAG